jgi:hypothetical protein
VTDEELAAELAELILEKHFHVGHPYMEEYIDMGELREAAMVPTLEKRRLPEHLVAAR